MDLKLNEYERLDDLQINNLKIIQNKKYFCFGVDSVLLANFVKSNKTNNIVIDLCSGSGVIPILLTAKIKYYKILAIELQKEMYDLLKRNIIINKLNDKIYPLNENIINVKNIKNNLLKIIGKDKVNIITVNPPYKIVNTGIINENSVRYSARYEDKCTLEDVFKTSASLLNDGGKLYMVHKPERLVDLLELSRKYKLEAKYLQIVYPRVNEKASLVLLEYVKNGGNELKVLSPLIEYNSDGKYASDIFTSRG